MERVPIADFGLIRFRCREGDRENCERCRKRARLMERVPIAGLTNESDSVAVVF